MSSIVEECAQNCREESRVENSALVSTAAVGIAPILDLVGPCLRHLIVQLAHIEHGIIESDAVVAGLGGRGCLFRNLIKCFVNTPYLSRGERKNCSC